MIRKWKLTNFKSVSKRTELKFEPLTVFAGANSSGKSTIIQSILLATQTIQNPVTSRSVILNGHISKFGNYNDILSHDNKNNEIEIGFTLEPNQADFFDDFQNRTFFLPFEKELKKVDLTFKFFSDENQINQLNPTLSKVDINSIDTEDKKQKVSIKKTKKDIADRINEYKIKALGIADKKALEYEVDITPNTGIARHYYRSPHKTKFIGVNMMHFLPFSATGVYNELENEINHLTSTLEGKTSYVDLEGFENEGLIFNDELKKFIMSAFDEIIEETTLTKMLPERLVQMFQKHITTLRNDFTTYNLSRCIKVRQVQRFISTTFQDKSEELKKILNKIDTEPFIRARTFPLHMPELEYLENQFKKNVKYLGPLRDEPKAIYPLEGYADSTDIGFKGENTAAVLELHKNTEIHYVPSFEFENKNENKQSVKATLQDAVLDWLVYLGVATKFETTDKGKLGHELTVSTDKTNRLQDLTHVGVGVSQVLPILVLSLLANSDSTLIFEQPELHLHPKVQTRLADFFISQNILKKQCIVETHSEYLINRLRYLVAISDGESLSNDSILYFVEKEGGYSVYNEIRINKYGVIKDWPKGFFDESEQLASKMLEAAMNKRNKERNSK
jgi:predicted ATPase